MPKFTSRADVIKRSYCAHREAVLSTDEYEISRLVAIIESYYLDPRHLPVENLENAVTRLEDLLPTFGEDKQMAQDTIAEGRYCLAVAHNEEMMGYKELGEQLAPEGGHIRQMNVVQNIMARKKPPFTRLLAPAEQYPQRFLVREVEAYLAKNIMRGG